MLTALEMYAGQRWEEKRRLNSKMAEAKASPEKPKGYYIGEIIQEMNGQRVLAETIARPNETGVTDRQAIVDVLNKLDSIYNLIKTRL